MWMRDPSKTQPKIQTPEADKHKSLVEIPIKLELKKKSGPAEDRAKVQDCNGYLGEGAINTDDFKKFAAIRVCIIPCNSVTAFATRYSVSSTTFSCLL